MPSSRDSVFRAKLRETSRNQFWISHMHYKKLFTRAHIFDLIFFEVI